MTYLNYSLIFAATALFFFIVILHAMHYMQEKLEFSHAARYEKLRLFISPQKLLLKQVFTALITACLMFLGQLSFGVEKMQIAIPVATGFAVLAFMIPYWYYVHKLKKRQEEFESKILDLAMGIANGMRSGLALGQAVEALSKRMGGPMKEELVILLREHRLGLDLAEAFERLHNRMPCEDLHLLVTTISLTTKSGGSLVEVLEEIVETIKARKEFQDRLKNMTAQGRFEALVISCAPLAAFILLYIIDPVLMRPLISTGFGWLAIGGACFLVTTGYFVLRKIITVEV